jgi:hypothetical protein
VHFPSILCIQSKHYHDSITLSCWRKGFLIFNPLFLKKKLCHYSHLMLKIITIYLIFYSVRPFAKNGFYISRTLNNFPHLIINHNYIFILHEFPPFFMFIDLCKSGWFGCYISNKRKISLTHYKTLVCYVFHQASRILGGNHSRRLLSCRERTALSVQTPKRADLWSLFTGKGSIPSSWWRRFSCRSVGRPLVKTSAAC